MYGIKLSGDSQLKKYLKLLYILLVNTIFIFSSAGICFAEVIPLGPVKKNEIKLNNNIQSDNKNLVLKDRSTVEDLIRIQKEDEVKDIEALWRATIDNNELIKFTMNKLNTPESQRRLHSSLMAKGLSSLIYGASFIPMFTGSNAMIQSASFSASRLANNFINKDSSDANQTPITDTELIQLAGTIEELQEKIISSYYEYKGSLNKLKDTRARIILYNKNYSKALRENAVTELIVSSALYEDMQLQEYKQEQDAKKYYLSLERLAGKATVDSLILSQYALKNQLINTETVTQK